jgi:hypothetical protein
MSGQERAILSPPVDFFGAEAIGHERFKVNRSWSLCL